MQRIRYETPPEERFEPYDRVGTWSGAAAGAVMGALGGLAMIAVPTFVAYITNNGAFTPLRIVGTIGNARHTDVGTATVLFGLVLLLGTTAALGAIFGALCNRQGRTGGALPWGIGYSFLWLLIMTYGVLPMMHVNLFAAVKAMPIAWFVGAFVYGFFIGMTPILSYWGRSRYLDRNGPVPVVDQRAGAVVHQRPTFRERWRMARLRHAR